MTIKTFILQHGDIFWFVFGLGSGFAMSSVLIFAAYISYSLRKYKFLNKEISEILIALLFIPGIASYLALAAALGVMSEGNLPALAVLGLFVGVAPLYLAYWLYKKSQSMVSN